MRNYISLAIFLGLIGNLFSQSIQQVSYIQSSGGGSASVGNYKHECVIGGISSGIISTAPYSGSSIGILYSPQNLIPIANAGVDIIAVENSLVSLSGAASSDPEGSSLTYTWTSLDGIVLNNNNVVTPNFTAPAQLAQVKYRFQLQVSDGVNISNTDTVVVSVRDSAWQPVIYTNTSFLICRPQFNSIDCEVPDVVGAFSSTGECRGLAEVQIIGGIPYGIFNVQLSSIEQISFRIYDYSQNQVCNVPGVFSFSPQVNVGSPTNPLIIDAPCIQLPSSAIIGTETKVTPLSALANQINVYPNPTNNEVTIHIQSLLYGNKVNIQLQNTLGQIIRSWSETLESEHLETHCDLSNYADGVYYLRVEIMGEVQTIKIIKESTVNR